MNRGLVDRKSAVGSKKVYLNWASVLSVPLEMPAHLQPIQWLGMTSVKGHSEPTDGKDNHLSKWGGGWGVGGGGGGGVLVGGGGGWVGLGGVGGVLERLRSVHSGGFTTK